MEGNTPTGVPAAMPDMQLCEHVHLMHTTTEDDKRAQCKEYITKLGKFHLCAPCELCSKQNLKSLWILTACYLVGEGQSGIKRVCVYRDRLLKRSLTNMQPERLADYNSSTLRY